MAAKRTKKTDKSALADGGQSNPLLSVLWVAGIGLWLVLAASLISFDLADPPSHSVAIHNQPIQNWVGRFGAAVGYQTYLMLGGGVWVLMAASLVVLVQLLRGCTIDQWALRITGAVLMAVSISVLLSITELALPGLAPAFPEGAGGLLAIFIADQLLPRFALPGTLLIVGVIFWVGAVLVADRLVMAVPRLVIEGLLRLANIRKLPIPDWLTQAPAFAGGMVTGLFHRTARRTPARAHDLDGDATIDRPGSKSRRARDEDVIDEDAGGLGGTDVIEQPTPAKSKTKAVPPADDADEDHAETDEAGDDTVDQDAPGAYISSKRKFSPDELREKMAKLPINFAPQLDASSGPAAMREVDLSGYQFPDMDLLEEPETNFNEQIEAIVREQATELQAAMQQYKIQGEVVNIDSGPVITLFEVRLAPGTKVSRLSAISSDLARALKAQNIRIVPNMAGKDTVGIEVPNLKKERVRLRELMTVSANDIEKMKLPMFLGKDASGNPLIEDLAKMPHMLIAGTTGSGKSVCMNSIIMSFLFTRRPDEIKMVLVDPKMVEMSLFRDIPHLMCPVVTEMAKASAILEWAVTKMDERYELLAEASVRDIAGYNGLSWDEIKQRMEPANEAEEARIPRKLPYLVFIIDELADLMMTNKEVEASIVRIAQKARAVGIHLILATQRPQANVVTGLIKSNMPSRIAFKVASGMDSRIVLDQKGGELLLGQGDMLYLSPRSSKLTRAQGTLVDDIEIRKTVKFLKDIAEQNFEPQLVQIKSADADAGELTERDELFDQAVEVVLESQRGSVSLLQRRLTIGYGRASRLIEQMEAFGIIGKHKTAQAREVLIGAEEWEAMKQLAEQESSQVVEGQVEDQPEVAHATDSAQVDADVEAETDNDEADEDDVDLFEGDDQDDDDTPDNDLLADDLAQSSSPDDDAYVEYECQEGPDADVPDEFDDEYTR